MTYKQKAKQFIKKSEFVNPVLASGAIESFAFFLDKESKEGERKENILKTIAEMNAAEEMLKPIADKLYNGEQPKEKEQVCIVCGIPWKDGKGFVGEHIFPCYNDRYGTNWVKDKPEPKEKEEKVCVCEELSQIDNPAIRWLNISKYCPIHGQPTKESKDIAPHPTNTEDFDEWWFENSYSLTQNPPYDDVAVPKAKVKKYISQLIKENYKEWNIAHKQLLKETREQMINRVRKAVTSNMDGDNLLAELEELLKEDSK